MKYEENKNDGIIGGALAHSAPRRLSPLPRLVTTGILNVKKNPFQRERALRYESVLPGTQVQIQNLFIITIGK